MGALQELSRDECRRLLGEKYAGRVAVVAPDGPHIVPVNYALVDESIVLRTSPLTLLAMHGRDANLAFQVDFIDDDNRTGWSVLVRGRSTVVFDSRELERIREVGEPQPWADGARNLYLRLTLEEISGRRVGPAATVADH